MTRKDFLLLATLLRRARPPLPWTGTRAFALEGWENAVHEIAIGIAEQTKKFDVRLFKQNAGVITKPPSESCADIAAEIARITGRPPTGERR